eukprot:3346391-Rhodomonas_salina.1
MRAWSSRYLPVPSAPTSSTTGDTCYPPPHINSVSRTFCTAKAFYAVDFAVEDRGMRDGRGGLKE